MHQTFLLTNVRLECGFVWQHDYVQGTECDLFTVEIAAGRIVARHPNTHRDTTLPHVDAGGMLMLPATRDMHIHLDKTFYGGPWRAARPNNEQNIGAMISLEQQLLPTLLPHSVSRAQQLVALLQQHGTTRIRSHCNIEPTSGLRSLEHLLRALESLSVTCDIVAFPQHGLLRPGVVPLMREAMQLGCQWVGGLDPTRVDGAMEASLDQMLSIALEAGSGVDIHLHEGAESGVAAINYLLNALEQEPRLQQRLTLSHAYCLAQITPTTLAGLAERMAALGVSVASCLPPGKDVMPLPVLQQYGVQLMTGTDSVIDHWSPFGTGSMLQKANLWAQLYTRGSELELNRALGIATGGILPLSAEGRQVWPASGDEADFILTSASCSAEVVARLPAVAVVYHQGSEVYRA